MKILITGASGFIGRHLVDELLSLKDMPYELVLASRNPSKLEFAQYHDNVSTISLDLEQNSDQWPKLPNIDAAIHLAWPELSNYHTPRHITTHFVQHFSFLDYLIASGVQKLVIAGTCFEYGMLGGELREDMPTSPVNFYALAKDTLRRALQLHLQKLPDIQLCWARIFYLYGKGQNPRSLIASLNAAIQRGDDEFAMSHGTQLRDYSPVEEIAHKLGALALRPQAEGIYNLGSGKPQRIIDLLSGIIKQNGSNIRLKPGAFTTPIHDPPDSWANTSKIDQLLS